MKNKNKRILSKFFKTENNTSSMRISKKNLFFCKFIFCVVSFAIYMVKHPLQTFCRRVCTFLGVWAQGQPYWGEDSVCLKNPTMESKIKGLCCLHGDTQEAPPS